MYIYLDKEMAKSGVATTLLRSETKVDISDYFGDIEVVEFVGDAVEDVFVYDEIANTIRNLTVQEKIDRGLYILQDGDIVEDEKIKTIPIPENLIVPKWVYPKWVESANDLEKAQHQYRDYKSLNNPLSFVEMEEKGIKQEYINMTKELQVIIYGLKSKEQITLDEVKLPEPSEELKKFKELFEVYA